MIKKEAYLEISNKCYCRCVMCDMYKQHVEAVPLPRAQYRLLTLKGAGFNQVRITGKEPMLYPWFHELIDWMVDSSFDIDMTTTLLTSDPYKISKLKDFYKLRISLFAMYEQHSAFYNIRNAFGTILRNIVLLRELYPNTIYFNYTLTELENDSNFTKQSAVNMQRFIKETGLTRYCFNIFPEFQYKKGITDEMTYRIYEFTRLLDSYGIVHDTCLYHPMHRTECDVNRHRIFIKHDGSAYPCCMASGEVGQATESQVLLGNIDTDSMDKLMLPLSNLDNPICKWCTPKYFNLMDK